MTFDRQRDGLFMEMVSMQKSLTKVPVTPDRILKIYQRESFRDNFISSFSTDCAFTPIAKRYL